MEVFGHALEAFYSDVENENVDLIPNLTCQGYGQQRWSKGDLFFKYGIV